MTRLYIVTKGYYNKDWRNGLYPEKMEEAKQ